MEVKKREPRVRRTAGTSVRKADQKISTSGCSLKRGHMTSDNGDVGNAGKNSRKKTVSVFVKNGQHRRRGQERYRQNGKVQSAVEKTLLIEEKEKQERKQRNSAAYGNNGSAGEFSSQNKSNGVYVPSGSNVTHFGKDTNYMQSRAAAWQGKEVEAAGEKITSAGKIGNATAGTAAKAASSGASMGVSTAVSAAKKAAETAKKTAKQVTEALQASVMKKEDKPADRQTSGGKMGLFIAMMAVAAVLPLFSVIIILFHFPALGDAYVETQQQVGAGAIVSVAEQEEAAGETNIGGEKYKEWYGMDADWCAMFLSWCSDQCGYIDLGVMPKTASVSDMKEWYKNKEQYQEKESGYEPKKGDIIFFGNGRSHVGLVTNYDAESGIITTIEGNTGKSDATPYHYGSRVKECVYPSTYTYIVGYGIPQYPLGLVEIPEPYGTEYSYMGWQTITSPTSYQYKLREEAGMNFDEDGFGKIGDRYVIACTLTFGQVGDYVDWELDNGTVIETVVGDIKNQNDDGCNAWGHRNGLCVVEFVVDKDTWYGSGRYPTDFHPEWQGRTIRAIRTGNYWQ